jgi:hypothetical protein
MRVTPAAAIVPLLVLLLTWLSLRAINPNAELFDHALGELDRFAMMENALYRDVFTARAGTLRNYDPLVRELDALRDSLDRLRETAAIDAETAAAVDQLAASIDRQEGWSNNSRATMLCCTIPFPFSDGSASGWRHPIWVRRSAPPPPPCCI